MRKRVRIQRVCSGNGAIQMQTHKRQKLRKPMVTSIFFDSISVQIERASARALGAGKRKCTKRATLRTQTPSARGGTKNTHAHFRRLTLMYIVSYVTGGEECSDAKPSKDVPGMFWKRCTLADEAEVCKK